MKLIPFLIDMGFKSFRWTEKGLVPSESLPYLHGFSTMQEGGLDIRFIKGDIIFIFGLSELEKPPTLIFPRPDMFQKIHEMTMKEQELIRSRHKNERPIEDYIFQRSMRDDHIERWLSDREPELAINELIEYFNIIKHRLKTKQKRHPEFPCW